MLLATGAAPLRAQPAQPPQPVEEAVRLQYQAPEQCPDAATFAAQVRSRTLRGRFADTNELARTFAVELSADAQGFSGELEFLDESGATVSRRVHGEQCDAVVSSLALVTALALDVKLQSGQADSVAAPAQPADATPLPAPRAPTKALAQSTRSSASAGAARSLRAARIGALAGYGSAIRGPQLGLLGQLDFARNWALRLSAHYGWQEHVAATGRSASLQLSGLAFSVCPWRFRRGAVAVAPCAALDLGWLRAAGVASEQLTSTRTETIWWTSLGAQLGLSWEPDPSFWLELRGALEFPLRAGYRFTFDNPSEIAFEVPSVAGSAAIAAGVRFW